VDDFTLTESQRALLPSDEDVAFYQKHGWYLSKKLLTDDEVDTMVAAADRYYAGRRDRTLPRRPSNIAYWEPEHGAVHRHNDYIFYEDDEIRSVLSKPIIAATAARLASTDQIRLWNSTLIYKPPIAAETSNLVPWHFDKHYWASCSSHNMLTAFIPFHDCDEEMGSITMVDGSHAWKEIGGDDSTARHFADRDRSELDELLEENARHNGATVSKNVVSIPKGHMSFHHCRIYHGSGHNRSQRPRQAISLHLQDRDNHWQRHTLSNGETYQYNNDVLVRRTPEGNPDYSDPEFCPVLWNGTP
jgi:ectoine hydroxylase-related dioxygenase (phytanoyl-CoA dioxygenase family)